MTDGSPWTALLRAAAPTSPIPAASQWLQALLARNQHCAYLRRHGAPRSLAEFRAALPPVSYEELAPWLQRLAAGEADVLFAGRPIAWERTGGSSGGAKLIPYSAAGLADFQRAVLPWLARTVQQHGIRGSAYLALSPATRQPEQIGGVPVGLPDGAYLGEAAGAALARVSAVPLALAAEPDVATWRARTLAALHQAHDLELISVWSPTFMLRLLDELDADPRACWPGLKLVSCWASGSAAPFAAELARRLPHAHLQPKGLLSTECVVTLPGDDDRARLNPHGFFEFLTDDGQLLLADQLAPGQCAEVLATTASGLYRYRTGDRVRCDAPAEADTPDGGGPVLSFLGRGGLRCDLVGEKLTEPFVAEALRGVPVFCFLAPATDQRGYLLLADAATPPAGPAPETWLASVEQALRRNPQYAYARDLGQLQPLRLLRVPALPDRYTDLLVARGVRLGDVKPVALRPETTWAAQLADRSLAT